MKQKLLKNISGQSITIPLSFNGGNSLVKTFLPNEIIKYTDYNLEDWLVEDHIKASLLSKLEISTVDSVIPNEPDEPDEPGSNFVIDFIRITYKGLNGKGVNGSVWESEAPSGDFFSNTALITPDYPDMVGGKPGWLEQSNDYLNWGLNHLLILKPIGSFGTVGSPVRVALSLSNPTQVRFAGYKREVVTEAPGDIRFLETVTVDLRKIKSNRPDWSTIKFDCRGCLKVANPVEIDFKVEFIRGGKLDESSAQTWAIEGPEEIKTIEKKVSITTPGTLKYERGGSIGVLQIDLKKNTYSIDYTPVSPLLPHIPDFAVTSNAKVVWVSSNTSYDTAPPFSAYLNGFFRVGYVKHETPVDLSIALQSPLEIDRLFISEHIDSKDVVKHDGTINKYSFVAGNVGGPYGEKRHSFTFYIFNRKYCVYSIQADAHVEVYGEPILP